MKIYDCYSAGPGLFPRTRPDGTVETWEESERRVSEQDSIISVIPFFRVITPTNTDLAAWPTKDQARACLYKDLLYAAKSRIVFANVTPFGGREPDSGTVVEAVTGALNGALLVLWADPLTTFAERYADADVHPDSGELDTHYNLMLEQLYYWSWEMHFGYSCKVFPSLTTAVKATAAAVANHGLKDDISLMNLLRSAPDHRQDPKNGMKDAVTQLLNQRRFNT